MSPIDEQPLNGGEQHQRFDYTPRRVKAFGRGYSLFVSILKFSLPAAALVIIAALGFRLSGHTMTKPADIAANAPAEKTTPGQIALVAPKYEGTDDQGRPYTVTADRADRSMDSPDLVVFQNPLADITLGDNSWLALRSSTGTYDHVKQVLTLDSGVSVFHDSGYEMTLQNVTVSLKDKSAASAQPVTLHGPMGTIGARSLAVRDQGNLIVFGGPATMTIFRLGTDKKGGRG